MPKSTRSEIQKAAGKKAAATLKKRLAAEKREALAAGKPPPLTPAQKAWQTIRARNAAKENARKQNETQLTKDLGQPGHDAQSTAAGVAPPAKDQMMPIRSLPAASTTGGSKPMTTMRAAFERAGVNTAKLELDEQVKALLAKNKNKPTGIIVGFDHLILRRRDLREVLLLDYAMRICDEIDPVGHHGGDAQEDDADRAPGQGPHDAHKDVAGGSYKRAPVIHQRSPAQKAAARQAMAESLGIWSRKIGDRLIGDIAFGELHRLRRDSIKRAGELTLSGIYCAADAILIGKILDHVNVTDMSTLVKDAISGEALQRLNHEAAREAPDVVDIGRTAYEGALTKQIEHQV